MNNEQPKPLWMNPDGLTMGYSYRYTGPVVSMRFCGANDVYGALQHFEATEYEHQPQESVADQVRVLAGVSVQQDELPDPEKQLRELQQMGFLPCVQHQSGAILRLLGERVVVEFPPKGREAASCAASEPTH